LPPCIWQTSLLSEDLIQKFKCDSCFATLPDSPRQLVAPLIGFSYLCISHTVLLIICFNVLH
jgi:hypothetical protein